MISEFMKCSNKTLKFAVFADLHYEKGMYVSSVNDLEQILDRACESDSAFVIHAGDFCNDYRRSPELTKNYLQNRYDLPAYGIYGNHELESRENCMAHVTPLLCNREVVWGTEDGNIGNGEIGYYYFDLQGFRIICLDSNYSLNPDTEEWEHNPTASWGAPAGNLKKDSLGDRQLNWLERVLQDAAEQELHCLIFSHMGFSGRWKSSPDTPTVQAMIRAVNERRRGTVLLSVNGHLHTNHQAVIDNVLHFDVNAVRNGLWLPTEQEHYGTMTYPFTDYDSEGAVIGRYDRPLSEAWMSKQTWYTAQPLSAIVTVSADGRIVIEGSQAQWYGGVVPDEQYCADPQISNGSYQLNINTEET